MNQVTNNLLVVQHPDKTLIGRIAWGFDFLDYWFSPTGLGVARKMVERMRDKVSRLYEQGADETRVEEYVRRWGIWVRSGVDGRIVALGLLGFVPQPNLRAIALVHTFHRSNPVSHYKSGDCPCFSYRFFTGFVTRFCTYLRFFGCFLHCFLFY